MGFDNPVAGVNSDTSSSCNKIRKPYTITKSRQNWTDIEHDKFLEALHLFDRDWKKIEAFVGSKTAIQIRSHAQKYFMKVQKNGMNEHVPPPRPKKKAAHPYPHKAPKNDVPKVKHEEIVMRDSYLWPTQGLSPSDYRFCKNVRSYNCSSSSIDSGPMIWPIGETTNQHEVKQRMGKRVMPDFPEVYRFIGGMFDPNERGHLQKLKMMDPVDAETVVALIKNLCTNLTHPRFEDYRRLFSLYDAGTGKVASNGSFRPLPRNAIPSS